MPDLLNDQAGDVAALQALKFDDDARTISEMIEADDHEDVKVVEAEPGKDGWTHIQWEDERFGGRIGCGIKAEAKGGDVVRLYGSASFGGSSHGVAVNGHLVYWRTPWERFAERVQWLAQYDRDKRESHERDRESIDRRVAELPRPLRERIERLRREDPKFRIDSEAYEMAAVGDAPKIARAVAAEQGWDLDDDLRADADEEAVKDVVNGFMQAGYVEQKRRVPDLDDGHSGNTFGGAVHLAYGLLVGQSL